MQLESMTPMVFLRPTKAYYAQIPPSLSLWMSFGFSLSFSLDFPPFRPQFAFWQLFPWIFYGSSQAAAKGTLFQQPEGELSRKEHSGACKHWAPWHQKPLSRWRVALAIGRNTLGVFLQLSKRPKGQTGAVPEGKISQVSKPFLVCSFPLLEQPYAASQMWPLRWALSEQPEAAWGLVQRGHLEL